MAHGLSPNVANASQIGIRKLVWTVRKIIEAKIAPNNAMSKLLIPA